MLSKAKGEGLQFIEMIPNRGKRKQ